MKCGSFGNAQVAKPQSRLNVLSILRAQNISSGKKKKKAEAFSMC